MTVPPISPINPPIVKKILIARFANEGGAKQGLAQLKNAGARLGNAAVIQRESDGTVSFKETEDWGVGKSAAVGALAALVLPGIGPMMGALVGGLAAYFIDAGFPDALLKQIGSGLDVGASLLVVLVREDDQVLTESVLVAAGGTILGHGLESDLAAVLEKMRQGGVS